MSSFLFVCIGNACRSQMAEGFARSLKSGSDEIFSAGSHPAGFVADSAVAVMKERGIDISRQYSKGIGELPRNEFDYVITMGCGDDCPWVSATQQRIDWKIEDPIGKPLETFRRVRDEIEKQVRDLLTRLPSRD